MLSSRFQGPWITLPAAFCIVLYLGLPSFAAAQSEDAARRHFAAAHAAQDAGDLDKAAREYLEVTRLLPETAEGYASLGMVYNAQGKFAESAHALAKANQLKPGLPGVSLYLGIDYEQQHQARLALPPLAEAVRLDAASKDANLWLGRALWDAGRQQQALAQLRRTSVLFPADPALLLESGEGYHKAAEEGIARILESAHGSPLAHQIYGDIYKDERAWSNASAHYYRALALDPHWAGSHFGLGEVALQQKKFDIATEQYEQELKTNPRSASSLARLGELAMLLGNAQEALPRLAQAIQLSGYEAAYALGLPRAYPPHAEELSEPERARLDTCRADLVAAAPGAARSLALAFAEQRLGNPQASALAWQEFVRLTPPASAGNLWERGQADFFRQDFEQAASHLDAWQTLHPEDLTAQYLLATTYRNLSLKTLEQLLSVAPDSYPAHILLAETYENAEQDAKALTEFRTAANLAPDLPGVHYSIGHLLAKSGQQEAARDEFAAELRLNPNHPEANAEMGAILLEQQETANAIPYLARALKVDPDLWSAYSELGKAYYAQKDYPRAEAALRQAVRHDPQGLAHYQLGLVYRSLGQKEAANAQFAISRKLKLEALTHDETKMTTLQQATSHLEPAESLPANDAATSFSAIVAGLKSNAPEEAVREALRRIDVMEQHSGLSAQQEFALAEMLNGRQMYSAAAARFRRIAEMQPGSWQNQYNLAIALVRARQVKEALPLLAGIAAEHSSDANLLSSVASTYETAGETRLALDAYRQAIAAEPANPDRYLDASRLLMDLDRYDEATALVHQGIAAVADDYPLTIRLGAIEMMRGKRDTAREHYRKAVAEHPALALGYVALAQSYMKEGNDQEALKILTEGRTAVGSDFALEYVFGLVCFQMGQTQQTMSALKNAEGLSPSVVEPHYQLGLLYMKLQQWPQAQEEFEQVLKLDPKNAGTYYQLSRTYQRLGETQKAQEMAKQASVLAATQREEATKAQELRFGVPVQKN